MTPSDCTNSCTQLQIETYLARNVKASPSSSEMAENQIVINKGKFNYINKNVTYCIAVVLFFSLTFKKVTISETVFHSSSHSVKKASFSLRNVLPNG